MFRNSMNVAPELKQLTAQINNKHQQCQAEPARALLSASTIGNLLLQVKAILSESEWQTWLQDCCSFSEASAQTYMVIAARDSFLQAPIKSTPKIAGYLPEQQVKNSDELVEEKEADEVVITAALAVTKPESSIEEKSSYLAKEKKEKKGDRSVESTAKLMAAEENGSFSAREKTSSEKSTAKEVFVESENKEKKTKSKKQTQKTEKKSNNIVFYIAGNVVPKARPRVTSKGTYLPKQYRQWRNMAEVEIYRQVLDMNLSEKLPLKKAAIFLSFCGKHRTNSDLDNMAGACLDALTLNGAGVLKDDRLSCIPKLSVEYVADDRETGVWITIEPID